MTATTRTRSRGKPKTVRKASGRTYKVKPGGGSIRNTKLWRLGTVEEGSTFHATHRKSKSKEWVWGYVTQGPRSKGAKELTYAIHERCGWMMLENLTPVKRKFKPPPIGFKRWHLRVLRWIKHLFVNDGFTKEVRNSQGKVIKKRKPRKDMPVFTSSTPGGDIIAYKNHGNKGQRFEVPRKDFKGVRYLTHDGYYMAWAEGAKWCFFPADRVEKPPLGKKAGHWAYPFDRTRPRLPE